MIPFCENVQEAMRLRGLTLRGLASGSGISQPVIRQIVMGEYNPSLDQAVRISRALGYTLDYLCAGYYGGPTKNTQRLSR